MAKKKASTKGSRTIKITCQGAAMVSIKTLEKFQGQLKTLETKKFEALKASLITYGFSFPMQIWKQGRLNHIIDGHQRLFVVLKMLEEGWRLESGDKLPVNWIFAKNKTEAKEKVLLAMSEYGNYDENAMAEFIQENRLNWERLRARIAPPKINLGTVHVGWFVDKASVVDLGNMDADGSLAGGKQFEDKPFYAVFEIPPTRSGDEKLKTALELLASQQKLKLTFRR